MGYRYSVGILVAASAASLGCGSSSGGARAADAGQSSGSSSRRSSTMSPGGSSAGTNAGSSRGSTGAGSSAGSTSAGSSRGSTSSGSSGGATDGGGAPAVWVMGYYTSWNSPANGGNYAVSAIDWDGLTHVAAAFYVPDGHGGWASGYFDAVTASSLIAAAHANGRKALASIGGSGSGPAFEGSTQGAMSTFVSNLEALVAMGYDGLDIDWEGGNLSTTEDQSLQSSLIAAIRAKSPAILLTLTAGYENENSLDDLSWYGTISAQLDRINLMTYGMSGAWQGWESWHSSPLHWNHDSSTPTGIDSSVSHYLAAGVPAAKLGVGTGFYGECYTAPVTAPVAALGGSQVAASDGTMAYANILTSYYSSSAYRYDSAADVPYLTLSGSNAEHCTFVTYEDATSIAAKGAWVKAQGLGGTIIWQLSEGYVASGANVQAQNPLLETMKTAFLQ